MIQSPRNTKGEYDQDLGDNKQKTILPEDKIAQHQGHPVYNDDEQNKLGPQSNFAASGDGGVKFTLPLHHKGFGICPSDGTGRCG